MATQEEIDNSIRKIVAQIRDYKADAEHAEVCIDELKVELRDLLEQRGENWSDDEGYARIVSEGERVSYDSDALDNLLIEDPLRYGWLKEYRLKSKIQGRVQVK